MNVAFGAVPGDLPLRWPGGAATTVADALGGNDLTIVQLVRYYGCLPCQEWLVELDRADLPPGVGAAAVGGSAAYQAEFLREDRGVSMPLLLDLDREFRGAVGANETLGGRLLDPRGGVAYLRSLRHGYRPKKPTKDTVLSPAVVILDRAFRLRWRYVGARIGDYPPLEEVRTALSSLD